MYQKRRVHVLDSYVSYIDTRAGEETVVFLHGNLSYSFTWRNIIPKVDGYARCLAPDLLGHGDSAKDPDETYSFLTHYSYLHAWIEAARLPKKIIIVGHDWGAALGAMWASKNPGRVKGFVHMEGIVAPFSSWKDLNFDQGTEDLYKKLRDPLDDSAKNVAMAKNLLIETSLAKLTIDRKLSDFEVGGIKRPYAKPGEARKAAIAWICQLPVESEDQNGMVKIMQDISTFMETSQDLPKLFLCADPGVYSQNADSMTRGWASQRKIIIKGRHFPHEDDPEGVGEAIGHFIQGFVHSSYRK